MRGRSSEHRERPCRHGDTGPAQAAVGRAAAPVPRRSREPLAADRGRGHLPDAVRVHRPDLADDERAGAVGAPLAEPVPLAQLHRRLPRGSDLAVGDQHVHLLVCRDAGRALLEHPGGVRAVAHPLAGTRPRIRHRPRGPDAAACRIGRAAVRDVGEAPSRWQPRASDHSELVRRRVLDLSAAPVLPDDSRGIPRRGTRRRLRRAADPADRRAAAGEARDRGGRALLVPLHVQRLLPAAAVSAREPEPLGAADRALGVPVAAPGAVEPDDGRNAARDGARDPALLRRAEGLRRGRDADGCKGMKIAVIGGGSTYTPELVSGLSRERDRIDVRDLVLHDIDEQRREIVGGLAARMLARQGYEGALQVTDDLDRAVDGADFVLIQIRVGGQEARLSDETVPLVCGCIGQETTGAGGLGKALRTVPVVLEIAERVCERAADGAWIVDFTNPVGIVTRSLLDHGHRAVGLCNVAIGFQRSFARMLGAEPERVLVDQVGLNHLTWVRRLLVDGDDVLPGLLADHPDELAAQCDLPPALLDRLGVIPSYYLRYFYFHDEILASQLTDKPRAAEVAEIERELLELYRDPSLTTKPKLLEQRGGAFYSEAATQLVASLASDSGDAQVVDVRNNGTLAGLADDDAVEVPARITAEGPKPLEQPPLAPELLGLIQHVATHEHLQDAAPSSGDRKLVYKALLAHPLVGQVPPVEELTEQLLAADREHLPQFFAQERA